MAEPGFTIRSWVRGSDNDVRSGLLGFLSLYYGVFVIDGVTVRRTADGRLTLSWPERRDRQGRRHAYVRPIDDEARQRIEREIFGQAAQREDIAMEVRDG